MSETKDGGPAYPVPVGADIANPYFSAVGMSLRDYFAGQAITGALAAMDSDDVQALADGVKGGHIVARAAYQIADAMLKAREARHGK